MTGVCRSVVLQIKSFWWWEVRKSHNKFSIVYTATLTQWEIPTLENTPWSSYQINGIRMSNHCVQHNIMWRLILHHLVRQKYMFFSNISLSLSLSLSTRFFIKMLKNINWKICLGVSKPDIVTFKKFIIW